MGSEIAQTREWHHDRSLDWWLLDWPPHAGVRDLVRELNLAVTNEPALWESDREPGGFRWLDADDAEHSVYSFVRFSADGSRAVACLANFTPVPREGYRLGLPYGGSWQTLLDTNAKWFWGTGYGGVAGVETEPVAWHGYGDSAVVTLPPPRSWFAVARPKRRPPSHPLAMSERRLVIHGHFYQPPRENPWTETVPVEPSAAPDHDWNERITEEAYRPNAFARIMDDHGSVVALVDNYRLMSFNVGPTLLSWLESHHDDVYSAIVRAGRESRGAIAQGYSHLILPPRSRRDMTTQAGGARRLRASIRAACRGMWLPETAVNDEVLEVLAEEGVGFTILAPDRRSGCDRWERATRRTSVDDGSIDTRHTHRWCHPSGDGRGVTIVFYEGPLPRGRARPRLARARRSSSAPSTSCPTLTRAEWCASRPTARRSAITTDGASGPSRTLAVEAAARARHRWSRRCRARSNPEWEVEVKESAWSCARCGPMEGGLRLPHRRRSGMASAVARRCARARSSPRPRHRGLRSSRYAVMHDPWAARDATHATSCSAPCRSTSSRRAGCATSRPTRRSRR
jgi:hypothetical protein